MFRKQDDGGLQNGGADSSEVTNYEFNVEPSRRIPTFSMPAMHATLEASGTQVVHHFIQHISAGPALEFHQVVDSSFVLDYQSAWFSEPPTMSRLGTLQFWLAPHVFGSTEIHVSLTARSVDGSASRINTQHFNLGKDVPPHARSTCYTEAYICENILSIYAYSLAGFLPHSDRGYQRCSIIHPEHDTHDSQCDRGRL